MNGGGFAANWRGGSGRYDRSRAFPMMFPSRFRRINGIASPAIIRLAIERSTAEASDLHASGCLASSESVRVLKAMRIMGIRFCLLHRLNRSQLGGYLFQLFPPKGRRRRSESAAEPGLPNLSSSRPISQSTAPFLTTRSPPQRRFIQLKKGTFNK